MIGLLPQLICIAGDLTRYDEHAVKQIARNIELIRYRWFGEDLLMLKVVNGPKISKLNSPSVVDEAKSVSSHNPRPISVRKTTASSAKLPPLAVLSRLPGYLRRRLPIPDRSW